MTERTFTPPPPGLYPHYGSPNPTTSTQYLKVTTSDVVALEVYDALGRKVFVSKVREGITTDPLPAGIKESVYKVKLISEKTSTTQTLQIK